MSWAQSTATFESNIMGSLHLFDAVRQMNRAPVVVSACSVPSMDTRQRPPYRVPKNSRFNPCTLTASARRGLDFMAREYFVDYNIPTVSLRLFNTTGPRKNK